jgi:hypothetical protein
MDELIIEINGTRLTVGQAMTVRVALNALAHDLEKNNCGEDERDKRVSEAYRERLTEIFKLYE